DKTDRQVWFTQAPRPPTFDPEWNKRQVVTDQLEQPWFKEMISAVKDPISFNDLMDTPIDFSKFVLNRLKINNLTQDILLGPAFNLLKAGSNQGKTTKKSTNREFESAKKPSTTKETTKGKAPAKIYKTGKSAIVEELIEEPIAEVLMDDTTHDEGKDTVHDDDQPQDSLTPKKDKTDRQDVSELKKIDHSAKALAALKSQVPMVVESKKTPSEILKIKKEHAEK
nr:hypothetical protein [Tanacetum cinerariifolium]